MKTMTTLLFAMFFLFGTIYGQQEMKLKNKSSYATITGDEVLNAAKQIQQKAGNDGWRFLQQAKPTDATQKRMLNEIKKGKSLVERVVMLGDKITDKQAAIYDRQMNEIVTAMDKLYVMNHTPGGQGECFGGCDNQYQGFGHGKGWNRIWCKVSCFKIVVAHVG